MIDWPILVTMALGHLCLAVLAVSTGHASQQTPSAKDLSAVIEMLRSPDPVVRVGVACARDVFNGSTTAAIPALVELLNDGEPERISPLLAVAEWVDTSVQVGGIYAYRLISYRIEGEQEWTSPEGPERYIQLDEEP